MSMHRHMIIYSKNEEENALSGLRRPDSILKPEDFISIRANWDPKSVNLAKTAREMNLITDSYVFVMITLLSVQS